MTLTHTGNTFPFSGKHLFITVIILLISVSPSYSQQGMTQHKVKDRIEVGGGQFVEILQVRGSGQNEEWYVQYYRGQVTESIPSWENAESLKIEEQRIIEKKLQDGLANNTPSNNTLVNTIPPEKEKITTPAVANNTNCTFTPPSKAVLSADIFSLDLAKRKMYDNYAINVNGTGSAPMKVGVTFLSFSAGPSYKNTVTVDPVRGAERKHDGAPVNAMLYTVYSKHIMCEQYKDGSLESSQIEGSYVCFKNKDGNWACTILGLPKIIHLKN